MDNTTKKGAHAAESDKRFMAVLEELQPIHNEVVSAKNWFARNSSRPRILFRLVGGTTISLSVLVPFLVTLDGPWKTLALPAATVLIAALTGLNAFFQWQTQWQSHRQTKYALEHLLSKWEIEIIKAKLQASPDKAIETAIGATSTLLDQAREITSSTTGDYFKSIQLPSAR